MKYMKYVVSGVFLLMTLLYIIMFGVSVVGIICILAWGIGTVVMLFFGASQPVWYWKVFYKHRDAFFRAEIQSLLHSEESLEKKEEVFRGFNDASLMEIYLDVEEKCKKNCEGVAKYLQAFDYKLGGQEFTIQEIRRLTATNKNLVVQLNKLAERVISLEVSYGDVEDEELNDLISSLKELSGR